MSRPAAQRIREALNATGGYRLTGESSADWEGNACGAGLDELEREIELLLGDLFADTASAEQLDLWESAVRPQPLEGDLETRRSVQAAREKFRPDRFAPEEWDSMLRAAGVQGALTETDGGLRVVLGKFLGVSRAEALLELDQILPAHLSWELSESVAWPALEAAGKTFQEWDAMSRSWAQLDAITRTQLGL